VRDTIFYNFAMMGKAYSHSIYVGANTDITIYGEENKTAGYQWKMTGSECSNLIVAGSTSFNQVTHGR